MNLTEDMFPSGFWSKIASCSKEQLANFVMIGYQSMMNSRFQLANESSYKRGLAGEINVENILRENYNVLNVTQLDMSGDLIVTKPNSPLKILVEVKNYSSPIAYANVQKFYRDIDAGADIKAGLFISLNTRICTINDPFHFAISERNIPVIFLQSGDPNIIKLSVEILHSHLTSALNNQKQESLINDKYQKLTKNINAISTLLGSSGKTRANITKLRDNFNTSISDIYSSVFLLEQQIQNEINNIYILLPSEAGGAPITSSEELADNFDKRCAELYQNTLLDNAITRVLVKVVLKDMYAKIVEPKIRYDNKISLMDKNDSMILMISPLKTKINLHIKIKKEGDSVSVPHLCKYEDGCVVFSVDRSSDNLDRILSHINSIPDLYF
jgi:hypothetical protein